MAKKVFLQKHWTTIVSIIIGALISFYFYHKGIQKRNLYIIEEPLRTLIVKAESIKDFPLKVVDKNGNKINKDISSMQFYFWNDGNISIKRENILKPLRVGFDSPDIDIIDFRVLSSSRPDITNIKLSLSPESVKSLNVDFDILENNDGFIGQIIYSGSPNAPFGHHGVIEGLKSISKNVMSLNDYFGQIFLVLLVIAGIFSLRPEKSKLEDKLSFWYYLRSNIQWLLVTGLLAAITYRVYTDDFYYKELDMIPKSIQQKYNDQPDR